MKNWVAELRAAGLEPELRVLNGRTEAEWIVRLEPDLNILGGTTTSPPPESNSQLSVYVSDETRKRLRIAAAHEDRSVTDLVAQLIDEGLAKRKR